MKSITKETVDHSQEHSIGTPRTFFMSEELIDKVVSAAQFGDFAFVKESVSGNRDLASAADANGCSLLHWACINNRYGS